MRLTTVRLLAGLATLAIFSMQGASAVAARDGFSLSSLRGSYAGIFSGEIESGANALPIVGSGIFVADGRGHLSGHETYAVGTGTACEASISGTYTISPDGSGADSIAFKTSTDGCSGGTYTQALAIAHGGALVLLTNTNGDQISEEWHLQRDDAEGWR